MDIPSNGFNPRATISEEVGITSITIRYSRPGVKGREGNIWGGVVAHGFGNFNFVTGRMTSPWRAGANRATLIEFEHDVKVEGYDLGAGTYALFIAMGIEKATLIFSKQTEAWGSFNYDESDDVLRVDVKPQVQDKRVEWLKYEFVDHEEDGCTIAMQWEKLSVPFRIKVAVDDIVMARIREEFKGLKGFINANRIQASMYFFEKNIHLEEALSWAEKAVTGKPFGQNTFVAYENLTNGYLKLGHIAEADSVLLEGLQIADLDQFITYNKRLIAQGRPKTALNVMQNAKARFGDIFAVNDGLSYAYSAYGDHKRHSVSLTRRWTRHPPNNKSKAAGRYHETQSRERNQAIVAEKNPNKNDMNSDKTRSRTAGVLYLFVIVGIMFVEFYVREKLIVWDDATATAQHILANERLFRLGFVIELMTQACFLLMVLVLYQLFKSVNKFHAVVMVAFVVVTTAIHSLNYLNEYAAMLIFKGSTGYLSVFTEEQLNALALFFLQMFTSGWDINYVFFSSWLLPLGYLVLRSSSDRFSRILGLWLMISCFALLFNFFTRFLDPGFYRSEIFWITGAIDSSEIVFCLWLLFKGVDVKQVE